MYDVFFISYDEPNANDNWERLLQFAPAARRISGVKGILNAHKTAAEQSNTSAFFVVDGDAWLEDDWSFYSESIEDIYIPYSGRTPANCVLVWKSRNPYNGLEYGYGGIKLMPKKDMIQAAGELDVATSVSDCFMHMDHVACETRFASSAWHAWRGAFRECAKLASSSISVITPEHEKWLDTWTNTATGIYAEYILKGAQAGAKFGQSHRKDKAAMKHINDYDWLKRIYDETL